MDPKRVPAETHGLMWRRNSIPSEIKRASKASRVSLTESGILGTATDSLQSAGLSLATEDVTEPDGEIKMRT